MVHHTSLWQPVHPGAQPAPTWLWTLLHTMNLEHMQHVICAIQTSAKSAGMQKKKKPQCHPDAVSASGCLWSALDQSISAMMSPERYDGPALQQWSVDSSQAGSNKCEILF